MALGHSFSFSLVYLHFQLVGKADFGSQVHTEELQERENWMWDGSTRLATRVWVDLIINSLLRTMDGLVHGPR